MKKRWVETIPVIVEVEKNSKNVFYLIDRNVYLKNKIINKIKKNRILIKSDENSKNYQQISKIIKKM